MKAPEITKGPWVVDDMKINLGDEITAVQNGSLLDHLIKEDEIKAHALANARLIAAAPVLFAGINSGIPLIEETLDAMRENRLTVAHSMALREVVEGLKKILFKAGYTH